MRSVLETGPVSLSHLKVVARCLHSGTGEEDCHPQSKLPAWVNGLLLDQGLSLWLAVLISEVEKYQRAGFSFAQHWTVWTSHR